MVVTMGAQGAVFATLDGEDGYCPAKKVDVKDTTGAGDAFFAGAVIGQTYGKTMMESCEIGTRLAASVITTGENVCPRYLPSEFRAGRLHRRRRADRARILTPYFNRSVRHEKSAFSRPFPRVSPDRLRRNDAAGHV